MEAAIKSTNDYGKFILHEKNRRLNIKKVERLAESMKKKNLLHLFPIIVNKKNEILDGQHRHEAAKLAQVKIFYLVSDEEYDIENVAETNNFQSHWKIDDYINYYCKEGKQEYIKIAAMGKKYKMTPSKIANLSDVKKLYEDLKNGNFVFTEYDFMQQVLSHARAIGVEYGFHFWNSRPFLRAIKHIMKIKAYNKLRMGQKIQANRKLLVKCHEMEEYIKVLEQIYNMKATDSVRFL